MCFVVVLMFLFCFLLLLENCLIVNVMCFVVLFVWVVDVVSFLEEVVILFIEFWIVWMREWSDDVILLKFLLSLFNLFFEWILMVLVKLFLLICLEELISCFSGVVIDWMINVMMIIFMIIVVVKIIKVMWRIGLVVLWILFKYMVLLIF